MLPPEIIGQPLEVGAVLLADPQELDSGHPAALVLLAAQDPAEGQNGRGLALDVDLERQMAARAHPALADEAEAAQAQVQQLIEQIQE